MVVQTTYEYNQPVAYEGQLADINPTRRVTRIAEGGAIPFGRAVTEGTAKDQAVIGGDLDTEVFAGVTIRDQSQPMTDYSETANPGYAEKAHMAILQEGTIYVNIPSASGSRGDPINYNDTTGIIDVGAAGAGESAIAGATLLDDVSAANTIARIRIK